MTARGMFGCYFVSMILFQGQSQWPGHSTLKEKHLNRVLPQTGQSVSVFVCVSVRCVWEWASSQDRQLDDVS